MTDEEAARFALQLREAERIRAQIAKDEATARADSGGDLLSAATLPAVEQSSGPAVVTAA